MAYTKQNFEDGQVLTAEHLNHMEQGIAAPDWNDVTNRPFGMVEIVILEEQSFTPNPEGDPSILNYVNVFGAKDEITAVFDGTTYNCVAQDVMGVTAFGNAAVMGDVDTGEPFLALLMGGQFAIFAMDASTAHTVSAVAKKVERVPIKYLKQPVFYVSLNADDVYLYKDKGATIKATCEDVKEACDYGAITIRQVLQVEGSTFLADGFRTPILCELFGGGTEPEYFKLVCYRSINSLSQHDFYYTAEYTG